MLGSGPLLPEILRGHLDSETLSIFRTSGTMSEIMLHKKRASFQGGIWAKFSQMSSALIHKLNMKPRNHLIHSSQGHHMREKMGSTC